MGGWRERVSPEIQVILDQLIEGSYEEHDAYKHAKNTANAQLWCALALIAKDNRELKKEVQELKELFLALKQKNRYLELMLKELSPQRKNEQADNSDAKEELKKFLKRI